VLDCSVEKLTRFGIEPAEMEAVRKGRRRIWHWSGWLRGDPEKMIARMSNSDKSLCVVLGYSMVL